MECFKIKSKDILIEKYANYLIFSAAIIIKSFFSFPNKQLNLAHLEAKYTSTEGYIKRTAPIKF
jgi:hypothetical protein